MVCASISEALTDPGSATEYGVVIAGVRTGGAIAGDPPGLKNNP